MQSKLCSKCKLDKPIENFNLRNKSKGQYQSQCNECRRPKSKVCKCGVNITDKAKSCPKCKILKEQDRASKFTLGDKIYEKIASSKYGYIRYRARTIAKIIGLKSCKICGYDKHVEICHIKAIKDFDDSTLISEINKPDNLIALCPTHHWEFDNGQLKIQ